MVKQIKIKPLKLCPHGLSISFKTTDDPEIYDLSECYEDPNYGGTCFDGLLDITRCMGNAKAIISSPHFYQSPSHLRQEIDNLSEPDPDLHETRIDIEPRTGMAIRVHKRIQFNIPLMNWDGFDCLTQVEDRLIPLLWVDEGADIDQENIDKIKSKLVTPIKALEAVKWTLIALGALMAILSIFMAIKK